MRHCSICARKVDEQNAPILTMGGFGNPKYLCDECSAELESIMTDRDTEKIEEAMKRLSQKLSESSPDSEIVIDTVKEIFTEAGERARLIKEGKYDFSLDVSENDGPLDVPEELLETEEDKALDAKDEKRAKLLDKIFNYFYFGIFVGFIILIIIYFFGK